MVNWYSDYRRKIALEILIAMTKSQFKVGAIPIKFKNDLFAREYEDLIDQSIKAADYLIEHTEMPLCPHCGKKSTVATIKVNKCWHCNEEWDGK